ncbi:cobyrinate a,c-diamide synthase [uncultured Hydrogenophaga sp.]|uniref:cobyrinate a,c-diamide synthase n=1 Tax=uncultured Hydrogenophaga sp. TaxID=199683 RepID=UPI00265E477E|nr:cobyrinate a,c-diamide synthase [uncultured Hydrogenophaga sp.]
MTRHCPAVLVAAPASGQGKTTVASALARLHARAGRRVRAFKCGPDFLDPHWLALATGHPVHNLDLWMTGEADVRRRLHQAAGEADLIVVEGVMGLFDGEPSAADLAQRLGLPVLAVIDASAMAGTFGALAFGLQHFRPGLPWAGVLANRVAGERHAGMLASALMAGPGDAAASSWLGAVMRDARFALPERHLGLTVAAELPDALARLDAAADALADTALGRMNDPALQRWAVPFAPPDPLTADAHGHRPLAGRTIAVARDAAYCFIYPANLDLLQDMGAGLSFFSPLADEPVPPCDALWLPGGYPELHAPVLSVAARCRESLQAHVAADRPVWAECGGMMMLFDTLELSDGTAHAGWGLLPGRVVMQQRLAALGPQQLDTPAGALRGHTFHYSRTESPLQPAIHATAMRGGAAGQGEAVYRHGSLAASYFHAWMPSAPAAAAALFLTRPTP